MEYQNIHGSSPWGPKESHVTEHIHPQMCMSVPIFQFIRLPSYSPGTMFVIYICDSISVLSVSSLVPLFNVPHISDIIWHLSFSLFLHSVWQALGLSMLLQKADWAKKERNYLFVEWGFCLSLIRNKEVVFIGRSDAEAPILWPPHVKRQLIGKDPDAGKDWGWEEKETTEDEMVGWRHPFNGHEFEQILRVGDGQGGLACCSPWGWKELATTEQLNWTEGGNTKRKNREAKGMKEFISVYFLYFSCELFAFNHFVILGMHRVREIHLRYLSKVCVLINAKFVLSV